MGQNLGPVEGSCRCSVKTEITDFIIEAGDGYEEIKGQQEDKLRING
jgi:hypothetical protein